MSKSMDFVPSLPPRQQQRKVRTTTSGSMLRRDDDVRRIRRPAGSTACGTAQAYNHVTLTRHNINHTPGFRWTVHGRVCRFVRTSLLSSCPRLKEFNVACRDPTACLRCFLAPLKLPRFVCIAALHSYCSASFLIDPLHLY